MPNKKPKLDAATAAVAKQVLAMPPKHNEELKVGRGSKEKERAKDRVSSSKPPGA